MADLTREEVQRIASLARLHLEPKELERLRGDLAHILSYFSALEAIDVKAVSPTAHVLEIEGGGRDDEPRPSLSRRRALAEAPDAAEGQFRVPRVLDRS